MEINRQKLLEALKIVKPGLASKEVVEQASSLAFMKGKLVTYNDEISITHPLEELSIEGVVKADELYQFIDKLKTDTITFIPKKKQLIVKSGRSRAGLVFEQEVNMPLEEIGKIKGSWAPLPEDFCEAVRFCSMCVGNDMSKPILTCINVTKTGFVEASDDFRAIRWALSSSPQTDTFLIPAKSALQVIQLNPVSIIKTKGWVHFLTQKETIVSCRIFEDKFPNVNDLLVVKGNKVTFPKKILDIIERALVFSKRDYKFDEKITVSFAEEKITISSESQIGSWFKGSIKTTYKGDSFRFSITPHLLYDILKLTNSFTLSDKFLRFEDNKWIYVTIISDK